MASQPPVQPDTIEPQSPPEAPGEPLPAEEPMTEPQEVPEIGPDSVEPGRGPDEV